MLLFNKVKPSLVPALLALFVLILVGFLLFSDLKSSRTELTLSPPIEIIEPLPLTVIEPASTPSSSEQVIAEEAAIFIDSLAKEQQQTISIIENKDQFVRYDSVITLPNLERRVTTIAELLADENITAETLLILHYTADNTKQTTLAELSDKYDDHTILITTLDQQGQTQTKPLFEYLHQHDVDLTASITLLSQQDHTLKINGGQLKSVNVIDHQQSIMVTINHGTQELSVDKIIQSSDVPDDALFYLHRVTQQDHQGLWGIIQAGLIDKFRQGVHIEGIVSNKDSVQVVIPADADEKLSSGISSFLGKILNDKVNSSYIYNFSTHTMSHDPNQIQPEQQLILIHFSPAELAQIYQFFSAKRNQGITTFAIDP